MAERPKKMTFQSSGQGLWSTVDDFLAFARLFTGAGAVDGVRILKPETMALMTTNRLSEPQRVSARLLGTPVFAHMASAWASPDVHRTQWSWWTPTG
jgi:CubicO group peptidase (beta-lactamase class C family)